MVIYMKLTKSKAKKKKHPSILEVVHETANGLYDAHIINAAMMKEFDELCLGLLRNVDVLLSEKD